MAVLFVKFILIHVFVGGIDQIIHHEIVVPVADLITDRIAQRKACADVVFLDQGTQLQIHVL